MNNNGLTQPRSHKIISCKMQWWGGIVKEDRLNMYLFPPHKSTTKKGKESKGIDQKDGNTPICHMYCKYCDICWVIWYK